MSNTWLLAFSILWIVVLVEGYIIYSMVKTLRTFVQRIQHVDTVKFKKELTPGTIAPAFKEKDQLNNIVLVDHTLQKPITLIFISPSCPSCKRLFEQIELVKEIGPVIFIAFEKMEDKIISTLSERKISYLTSTKLFEKYNISGVPRAVKVNREGYIEKNLVIDSWYDLIDSGQEKVG